MARAYTVRSLEYFVAARRSQTVTDVPCLFCQRKFTESPSKYERTREHVFGDWTTPYLKSPIGPGTQVRWKATRAEQSQDSYSAYPAQQAVQGVCKDCNSGWLSEIQTAAKPFLLPALRGAKRRSFGDDAQRALGIWAFRAALLAGVKAGAAAIPSSRLHDFYEQRRPPGSTRIWLAASGQRQLTYINNSVIKVFPKDSEPPERANAFASVLGIGHVAFCLVCWTDVKPNSSMRRIHEIFAKAVIPIWPVRGPVQWPPRNAFSQQGLDQLAGVFGAIE